LTSPLPPSFTQLKPFNLFSTTTTYFHSSTTTSNYFTTNNTPSTTQPTSTTINMQLSNYALSLLVPAYLAAAQDIGGAITSALGGAGGIVRITQDNLNRQSIHL
jgi:hypothetical protein